MAAAAPLLAQSFSYPDFSSTSSLSINYSAATVPTTTNGVVLRLTPAQSGQAGSAFSTNAISFPGTSDKFSTFFQFRITNPGGIAPADGLVFVLQTESSNIGSPGGGLGYEGITPSVGVEFDTYQNTYDINNNHVSIHTDGYVAQGLGDISPTTPYNVSNCYNPVGVFGCLANGDLWSVWIDYDGKILHIAVADNSTVRPADLIDYPISIPGVIESNSAFVGFTAGTGAGYENHDIVDWQFNNTLQPITGPTTPAPTPTPVPTLPQPSILGNGNLGEITLGQSVSATFTASGGTPPYTFSASSLPAGVSFSKGVVSGTPVAPGNYSFFIQLIDSNGQEAVAIVTLSVFGIATTSIPQATAYESYSATLMVAGGTQPASFSATGLPPGIALSSSGVLGGSATRAGTYTVLFTATDAVGAATKATLTLTVAPEPPLAVPAVTLPGGTVGISYSQTVSATGGATGEVWTVAAGTLPPGLSFNSAGVLFGTPQAAGSYAFSARVTDSMGSTAVAAIGVAISAPSLTFVTPSPLAAGMATVDYPPQPLAVSGGVAPYTFALASGSLPAGLTLSSLGTVSGTPSTAGASSFTVTATDSAGNTATAPFSLTVRPFAADLILSQGSLSFTLTSGTATIPPSQSVQVQSSIVGTILSWTVSAPTSVAWLTLAPGSGSTPGAFTVSLTPAALTLGASSASPYRANVTVTCASNSPCSGSTQTIAVMLVVNNAPPQLTALPSTLPLASYAASTPNPSGSLTVQNSGGGTLGIASVTADAAFVTIGSVPGSLGPGASAAIPISTSSSGLAPGFYRSNATIRSSAGSTVVPVTLFLSSSAALALEPQGQSFQIAPGGSSGPATNTFLVDASSSSAVSWNAAVIPGAPWLSVASSTGSSTLAQPGTVTYTINPTVAASLAPGAYYGRIEVTSSGIADSPLDFEVVLNVAANGAESPAPFPEGLLFITADTAAPPPQTVQVFANSPSSAVFQVSTSTTDGHSWLSVSPSLGTAAPATPAQTSVSVNPSGLTAGVYFGGVSYAFASAGVRTVNVTLIVTHAGSAISGGFGPDALSAAAAGNCTPSQLVPAAMGPLGNFSAPAAWPVPLTIQLFDNCGNAIPDGQIVATFSNGDPPLPLAVANPASALFSGTWTPRAVSPQIAVRATASRSGFPSVTSQVLGSVAPNNAPLLTPGGILNAFAAQPGSGFAPGTIVQVYGSYLGSLSSQASSIPLPTTLSGTSLLVGGIAAPLYYTSAGQVNAQIPFELTAGNQYQAIVSANGALTTPETIVLTPASPGLAAFPAGAVIAQHTSGSLVSETSPAKPGEVLVAYVAGFGATGVPVTSGVASPSSPLAQPVIAPSLTINSESAPILFAGLTPGLVGLYQINFQVPSDAANGDLPLVLSQGGVAGNATILPVHN